MEEEKEEGTVSGLIFAIFSAFLFLTWIFSVGFRTEKKRSEKENNTKKQENETIVNNVNSSILDSDDIETDPESHPIHFQVRNHWICSIKY